MYFVRRRVVCHARRFEWAYRSFELVVLRFDPVWRTLGDWRIERARHHCPENGQP